MRGSEDGAAILGVQDSEVVRERISQLREKLQSVRDMIAAQRGGGRQLRGDTVAAGEDAIAPPPRTYWDRRRKTCPRIVH